MNGLNGSTAWKIALAVWLAVGTAFAPDEPTTKEPREGLLERIRTEHRLSEEQSHRVAEIFSSSRVIGQGNPEITRHPATTAECRARWTERGIRYANPEFDEICGTPYMAPLYDPSSQQPSDAEACIDRFEFPGIPCEYPVVWVRAAEAARLCEAMGKRLCDAHEWEGACAGALEPPDYRFDLARDQSPSTAVKNMRAQHNRERTARKSWSYGPEYKRGVCGAASEKSPNCEGGQWKACGSNTYPAGFFPDCRSPLGVYDLHGNAAEHMNLPLAPDQMASRGSRDLGHTEMKGSWFIFDRYYAHEDWCRWRAPYWHGSRVLDPKSHHNYHLGFRCCKTLKRSAASED